MLGIRLLGELEVLRDGQAVPLPASKKSRALLAYLAAAGRPQTRERLCELLWDGPDDPRAQLRWSLTKLRPIIGEHLTASRDRAELRRDALTLDILEINIPSGATTEQLAACAALFRGEFLEDLDLPACFRFQQWCAAERERFRKVHIALLAELTGRLAASEAALPYARRRVMVDPFDDEAHAALIRLLAALGHSHDAVHAYEQTRELFQRELGVTPGPAIEHARRAVWSPSVRSTRPETRLPAADALRTAQKFVGRESELRAITTATTPVLILGEPGIGKSRLLEELGPDIYARAFASEMIRPYGLWIDALGDFPAEPDRTRLFEVLAERITGLVAIDDIQWIDEASAALLHYVVRKGRARVVLAARVGEIDDNPHALRLVGALAPSEVRLGPLSDKDINDLTHDARIAGKSGGNPLFALELSRSDATGGALPRLIASRLDRLDGVARELVSWAAAVGRQFDAEIVGRATGMPAGEMLAALEKLERSAIIRAAGEHRYDFAHDLIRDAAYQRVSGPRRALLHRHIMRALRDTHDPEGRLAGEIVHHATLAGELHIAALAAVDAGRRCLRIFAYGEATSVARRGLQLVESLSGDQRIQAEMELLEVLVMARTPIRERLAYAARIAGLTTVAREAGLHTTAALGAHLLASLHEESNNYGGAAEATILSAKLSQAADPAAAAANIANSAGCLLLLQRNVAHAEELIEVALAIGVPSAALSIARGHLCAHRGHTEEAIRFLEDGLALAARSEDHWREWQALLRLVTVTLEAHQPERALAYCARLRPVAAKMRGGSEDVRGAVMAAVARHAAGETVDIDAALAQLRAVDSKSDLAWVLTFLAEIDPLRAQTFAAEALEAAQAVGRESEAVIARRILGLPVKPSRDLTARAKRFLKEGKHGRTRTRTVV